jgi:hypothetical protein
LQFKVSRAKIVSNVLKSISTNPSDLTAISAFLGKKEKEKGF